MIYTLATWQQFANLQVQLAGKGELINARIIAIKADGSIADVPVLATSEGEQPQTKYQPLLKFCNAFDYSMLPASVKSPYTSVPVPFQVTVERLAGPAGSGIVGAEDKDWMSFEDALTFCGVNK